MIGRTVRVLEQNPQLVISIFYPTSGKIPLKVADLYEPCQAQAASILSEMGVDLDSLNITKNLVIGDPASSKSGAWPVVILSPGFGVERDMYLGIISKLVPKGYLVVTISAPNESVFTVYPDGRFIRQGKEMAELQSSDYGRWDGLLEDRLKSIIAVLEYLNTLNQNDSKLKGIFDLRNVALLGHSLGGAAALEVAKIENRIKAAIVLDPSLHLFRRDGVASVVPVLLLRQESSNYETMAVDMDKKIAYDYIVGQRMASQVLMNANYYRVIGSQHMSFSDIPLHYGYLHANQIHDDVVRTATAFMRQVFQGNQWTTRMALQLSETVTPIDAEGNPV